MLLILVGWYAFIYMTYEEFWTVESKLSQLKSQIEIVQTQAKNFSSTSPDETEKWELLKKKFLITYPSWAPFPREVIYNAAQKTYRGEQIPIESHGLFIYNLIYRIAEKMLVEEIKITTDMGTQDPLPIPLINFVECITLRLEFQSHYEHVMKIVDLLLKLPVVFQISELSIERLSVGIEDKRSTVSMKVKYFYRKNNLNLD